MTTVLHLDTRAILADLCADPSCLARALGTWLRHDAHAQSVRMIVVVRLSELDDGRHTPAAIGAMLGVDAAVVKGMLGRAVTSRGPTKEQVER